MSFNDDDHIFVSQDISGEKRPIMTAKTNLKIIKNPVAPLEEGKFKVMLELKGFSGPWGDMLGVDLVMVLDISTSMAGEKLQNLKKATQFVIKKLTPNDRLSIVAFSDHSVRLCPLLQVNEKSQAKIESLINSLAAKGNTNITSGLETALKVLSDRHLTSGRVVAIMLVSDGEQNRGGDAANIPIGNVAVFTFGFGGCYDPKVLKDIADNSAGGTFSDVKSTDELTIAFSQCLAGLLTVVARDLKLTITQLESTIEKASTGNYPVSKDDDAITISFGDLYSKEMRRIVVDLLVPRASKRVNSDILEITYTYRTGEKKFHGNPIIVSLIRADTSAEPEEREEVLVEENRCWAVQMIKEARVLADNKMNIEAGKKIRQAIGGKIKVDLCYLVRTLNLELEDIAFFIGSEEMYNKEGRRFVLACESSHERQRYATRGNIGMPGLYTTPRMNAYLKQATAFDEDPSKPLPTADEDAAEELAADPLAPILGSVRYYIQSAVQILKPLDKVLGANRA